MINLVALPCLCVDVFDGTDELRAGGEALNFAVHASKFEEFNVSILGAVGQDSYAKFIMDSVSDKRIDVSHVRVEEDKVTANNRTYLTADGDRYYKDDSWTGDIVDKMILNQDELDFIKKSEVVFIHFWAGCFEQIIDLKKNNNFRLAVDFVEYRNFKEMEKYAPYIDYFLISGEESILPIFEAFSKKYKAHISRDIRNQCFMWAIIMLAGALLSCFLTPYIAIPTYIIWLVLFFREVHFDNHKAFEKYLLK